MAVKPKLALKPKINQCYSIGMHSVFISKKIGSHLVGSSLRILEIFF